MRTAFWIITTIPIWVPMLFLLKGFLWAWNFGRFLIIIEDFPNAGKSYKIVSFKANSDGSYQINNTREGG